MMDEFCGSTFWNNNLTWNTIDPDLTICFQQTVLIWTPCILLFILSPLDLYFIHINKYSNIPWTSKNMLSLFVTFCLIIISILDIIMAIIWTQDQQLFNAFWVAALIKLVTFAFIAYLTLKHKKNGIVSSGSLFIFWFFLTICGIVQFRHKIRHNSIITENENPIWQNYQFITCMVYFPLCIVQCIIQCFADRKPQNSEYPKMNTKYPSPDLHIGFINKITFFWFERFAWRGWRSTYELKDIWDINPANSCSILMVIFEKYWKRSDKKKYDKMKSKKKIQTTNKSHGNIVPVLLSVMGAPFYLSGLCDLFKNLLNLANPQMLGLLITFVSDKNAPDWHGVFYSGILFSIVLGIAVFSGCDQYYYDICGYRVRTVLISAIYRKTLSISNASRKETTVGEIMNLMSVDVTNLVGVVKYFHELWSSLITIALTTYFLWQILGVSSIVGVIVLILSIPFNVFFVTKLKYYFIKQLLMNDERLKIMSEILCGIKVLKLYAWEPNCLTNVIKIRNKELQSIRQTYFYNGFVHLIWQIVPVIITLLTFTCFILIDPVNNKITPNTIFVSIALFSLLKQPLTMMPSYCSYITQTWVSIGRINNFLNTQDVDPNMITHNPDINAINIKNASFSWGRDEITLKNINLQLRKGEILAVVGSVGSGKSSLLHSIIGDCDKNCGSVNINGSVAYVAQQAWIQNTTLQKNILFGRPMEKNLYDAVIKACALSQDLRILPGGDQTEIGERGMNLSGGQKQRVAIARAIYSQADIYLLDDPLSAVDSHVSKHIFDNVLGPTGMLANKSRLLITHGISYLPKCDLIYVLNYGEITESGKFNKLLDQKGEFADLMLNHLIGTSDDEEFDEFKALSDEFNSGKQIFNRAMSIRSTISSKHQRSISQSSNKIIKTNNIDTAPVKEGTTLIDKEEFAVGNVGYGIYLRYIKHMGIIYTSVGLIAIILNQSAEVYSTALISKWSALPNANEKNIYIYYLSIYGLLSVTQAITFLISTITLGLGCIRAARILHENLLNRTLRLPMQFFDTTPLGRIMNRFSTDTNVVDISLPNGYRSWIFTIFSAIAVLIVISFSTPIFIGIMIPLAILYYFLKNLYVASSRQLRRIELVAKSPMYVHFHESITGLSTIRAYGVQEKFVRECESHIDYHQQCLYPQIISSMWISIRLELIGAVIIFFAAFFAVLAKDTMAPEIIGLSITYSLRISLQLRTLLHSASIVETQIVANERMEEYSNEKTEGEWITKPVDPNWPVEGKITFKDYNVRYRDGLDLVLKGINVNIMDGEKIGVVGRTGAGKSSLALGLFRIIESGSGSIVIDNIDISTIGLHSLRSRLTIIPQDSVIFSGTLRSNIDPFNSYNDEEIWSSLEHSHLKEFVKSCELGLLHEISENGENLSIGQQQLICLARALLRKTRILILDEATSAVDLETDDLIQQTIRTEFRDCTIITIAHRLNTIMDSDKVMVLDAGQIVEYDSPQTLLNNRNSFFYGLAKDAGLLNNSTDL